MDTAQDIWKLVVGQLSACLTKTAIDTWFADCEPLEIDDRRLVLRAGSALKKTVL